MLLDFVKFGSQENSDISIGFIAVIQYNPARHGAQWVSIESFANILLRTASNKEKDGKA
jgi:hypothetical protein